MSADTQAAAIRLLAKSGVAEKIGGTGSHVDYLERTDPTFPRGFRLGPAFNSAKRWVEHEVDAWVLARIASRDADAARASERGAQMAARLAARLPPGARRGGRRRKQAEPATATR